MQGNILEASEDQSSSGDSNIGSQCRMHLKLIRQIGAVCGEPVNTDESQEQIRMSLENMDNPNQKKRFLYRQ